MRQLFAEPAALGVVWFPPSLLPLSVMSPPGGSTFLSTTQHPCSHGQEATDVLQKNKQTPNCLTDHKVQTILEEKQI